jgi:hypothetical protein
MSRFACGQPVCPCVSGSQEGEQATGHLLTAVSGACANATVTSDGVPSAYPFVNVWNAPTFWPHVQLCDHGDDQPLDGFVDVYQSTKESTLSSGDPRQKSGAFLRWQRFNGTLSRRRAFASIERAGAMLPRSRATEQRRGFLKRRAASL